MHDVGIPDSTEKFRDAADFLFGILIAVALEKAVAGFLAIAAHRWIADPESPSGQSLAIGEPVWWLAFFRLIIFVVMIASFYFSSRKYFASTYSSPPSEDSQLNLRFRVDFFSGLVHFALFYAWSLCIITPGKVSIRLGNRGVSPFLLMLAAVLLYDVVWYCSRALVTRYKPGAWKDRDSATQAQIAKWTRKNICLVLGIAAIVVMVGAHAAVAEVIAIGLAFTVSLCYFPEIGG